jgi:predicted ATPase
LVSRFSTNQVQINGELMGPVGSTKIIFERVTTKKPLHEGFPKDYIFLNFKDGKGLVRDPRDKGFKRKQWDLKKPNQLGLGAITDSTLATLFNLREYIRGWRFYNSFNIDNEKIRKSAPTSQEPVLHEDAGNLSAVLFNLMTEHPESFFDLKSIIKSAIPGFKDLNVKARGGPGEVIAFWQENGIDTDLSLADLSDGTLRFIAWAALCVMPLPPTLICIDEPDQGVHPRMLPILAGLFEKASQRTQIVLATHSSYFLTQFELANIAVMKKDSGQSVFLNVKDSKTLFDNLEDFGSDELEKIHRTDELEALA